MKSFPEPCEGKLPVQCLRSVLSGNDGNPGWKMGDADRGLCLIFSLAARPSRPISLQDDLSPEDIRIRIKHVPQAPPGDFLFPGA